MSQYLLPCKERTTASFTDVCSSAPTISIVLKFSSSAKKSGITKFCGTTLPARIAHYLMVWDFEFERDFPLFRFQIAQ
jgi:hypothetical protein